MTLIHDVHESEFPAHYSVLTRNSACRNERWSKACFNGTKWHRTCATTARNGKQNNYETQLVWTTDKLMRIRRWRMRLIALRLVHSPARTELNWTETPVPNVCVQGACSHWKSANCPYATNAPTGKHLFRAQVSSVQKKWSLQPASPLYGNSV